MRVKVPGKTEGIVTEPSVVSWEDITRVVIMCRRRERFVFEGFLAKYLHILAHLLRIHLLRAVFH